MSGPRELVERWRMEADVLRRRGAPQHSEILIGCAKELEQSLAEEGDQPLTLAEAAAVSGYSIDHLGRLLRAGAIPNAGGRGRPRIRRAHVPRRVVRRPEPTYDPQADARTLHLRTGGGA